MIIEVFDFFNGKECELIKYSDTPENVLERIKNRIDKTSQDVKIHTTEEWAIMVRKHCNLPSYWSIFLTQLGQDKNSALATILALEFNNKACSPIRINHIDNSGQIISNKDLLELYFGEGDRLKGAKTLKSLNELGLLIFT